MQMQKLTWGKLNPVRNIELEKYNKNTENPREFISLRDPLIEDQE